MRHPNLPRNDELVHPKGLEDAESRSKVVSGSRNNVPYHLDITDLSIRRSPGGALTRALPRWCSSCSCPPTFRTRARACISKTRRISSVSDLLPLWYLSRSIFPFSRTRRILP